MKTRHRIFTILVILFADIAIAQRDPFEADWRLNATHDLQVLGWSEDEDYYAIRLYSFRFEENYLIEGGESLPRDCEGYVTHTGKKFDGALSIHIFHGNRIVANHSIQDSEECTPIAVAKERLRQARLTLKKYEIRLELPGEKIVLENDRFVIRDQTREPYTIEYKLNIVKTPDPSNPDYEQHMGSHGLSLISENSHQVVLKKAFNERFNVTLLHSRSMGIDSAYLSPSKEKILIYCYTDDSGMTHKYRALWLLGIIELMNGLLKAYYD